MDEIGVAPGVATNSNLLAAGCSGLRFLLAQGLRIYLTQCWGKAAIKVGKKGRDEGRGEALMIETSIDLLSPGVSVI